MTAFTLMGVLNVTPDSFSDGGRFLEHDHAVAQGRALAGICRAYDLPAAEQRIAGWIRTRRVSGT